MKKENGNKLGDSPGKPTGYRANSVDQSQADTVYAGFWQRVWATLIDTAVVCIVTFPIFLFIYPDFFVRVISRGYLYGQPSGAFIQGPMDFLLSWVAPALYVIIFWNMKGATPGKMIMAIRVVDSRTFGAPSLGSLVGRYFGYFLSTILLGLGFLWIAWDKEKRGFHDKLAGTAVINVQRHRRQ